MCKEFAIYEQIANWANKKMAQEIQSAFKGMIHKLRFEMSKSFAVLQ